MNVKLFCKQVFLLCIMIIPTGCFSSSVTYNFSGGRFGDNLVAYCHARWLSYKFGLNFLYRPFEYSDQLKMHTIHKPFDLDHQTQFKKVVEFPEESGHQSYLTFDQTEEILYVIPYFPECKDDIKRRNFFHFDIDWRDQGFNQLIKQEIASINPISLVDLPKDRIALAVHVRTGAGWDRVIQIRSQADEVNNAAMEDELKKLIEIKRTSRGTDQAANVSTSKFADKKHPLKFPPDSFYIEQIKKTSELLSDLPLYVHIFTDSSNPEELMNYYKAAVNKPNITYGCRKEGNRHDQNVLDDFFNLLRFDGIIRGESNLAIMASRIAHYKIDIFPTDYLWHRNRLAITDVQTTIQECIELYHKNPGTSIFECTRSN